MGWRGFLRAVEADMRRSARNAERRQKYNNKIQELTNAANTVKAFEDYIEGITKIHREKTCEVLDWHKVSKETLSKPPERLSNNEEKARYRHESFKPNFINKLFKSADKKKKKLEADIDTSILEDDREYSKKLKRYEDKNERQKNRIALANRIVTQDFRAYLDVIKEYNPFSSIENLGTGARFSVDEKGYVVAHLDVKSDDVVPNEKYSLRQSGTLSTKEMPKTEFFTLYQDYVCSCTLRVATELFAMLPLEIVVVNAQDKLLNPRTGHLEDQILLSVMFVRKTFTSLSLATVDPSDAMKNFLHNMKFKKTTGFEPVAMVESDML